MAKSRLELLVDLPVVELTLAAETLTEKILKSGLLPSNADGDAAHIALATVHELDILLSWNCRHIANAAIQARLRTLANAAGFDLPVICTPDEMMETDYEPND